jgi:hypothetical protein
MDASFLSGEIASQRADSLRLHVQGMELWKAGHLPTPKLAKLPESGAVESFTMCDQILGLEKDTQFPVASALAKTLAGGCSIG